MEKSEQTMGDRELTPVDQMLVEIDGMLRTLSRRGATAARPSPAEGHSEANLSERERKHIAGLMRVNHTGEVCAQALYQGQALTAKTAGTRTEMQEAAQEEIDHLVWCEERLDELGARPSALNPIFYGASLAMGAAAVSSQARVCNDYQQSAGPDVEVLRNRATDAVLSAWAAVRCTVACW